MLPFSRLVYIDVNLKAVLLGAMPASPTHSLSEDGVAGSLANLFASREPSSVFSALPTSIEHHVLRAPLVCLLSLAGGNAQSSSNHTYAQSQGTVGRNQAWPSEVCVGAGRLTQKMDD